MNDNARQVQRIYLTLMLGNTLAASFIWGINTLFLLDAGLSNFEAFAANAFFTAGMVLFEVPTGVIADTVGRRASYLLGTLTLAGSTLLYYFMWQLKAPFWAWALVSILIGLGFTFFSGAVEAWLVDALRANAYDGPLEPVFGRGQMVTGIAMLGGSVLGGVVAQVTTLGVPFLMRVGVLMAMFLLASRVMKDVGFTPRPATHPLQEAKAILSASITQGLGNRPVRFVMLAAPFTMGVSIYVFYALQPYLLDLYGDPNAYSIAGLAAAIMAGAQIVGGWTAPRIRGRFHKRTTALIGGTVVELRRAGTARVGGQLLDCAPPARPLGSAVRSHVADPAGLPQRHDPVAAAGHRALVRLVDGQQRRGRDPAGARQGRRRLELRHVLRGREHVPADRGAVPDAEPP